LNRSDSDGAMPHYKKGSFHRHSVERRSLRWKKVRLKVFSKFTCSC